MDSIHETANTKKNLYARFDALFETARRLGMSAAARYADASARTFASVRYSTPADDIGLLKPPFLYGQTFPQPIHKGRALKTPGVRTDYMEYLFDPSGTPYLIRSFRNGVLDRAWLFTEERGMIWAVPIGFRKGSPMSYEASSAFHTVFYSYARNGFLACGGMIHGVQLLMEERRYNEDHTGTCDFWNYIPKLHWSDQSIPVEQTGSPADLLRYDLMWEDGKITARYTEGWYHNNSEYRHCRDHIAAQVHEVVLTDGTVSIESNGTKEK